MAATTAGDIMQTQVVLVGVDDPLDSVYRLFVDEEISGAPVVDDAGDVVGVISIRDLVRSVRDDQEQPPPRAGYFQDGIRYESVAFDEIAEDSEELLSGRTVADVMTPEIVSVGIDTPIAEVAKTVLSHKVHRVIVVDANAEGAAVAGIISLFDLVQLLV